MYRVNRVNVITDIEQLLVGLFPKKELVKCAQAIYDELLQCTVDVLNDSSGGKIVDKVDRDFSMRAVNHELHMCIFDYFVDFVETVRVNEINNLVPKWAKYKFIKQPSLGITGTDIIVIDYEYTFSCYMQEVREVKSDILENPDYEQMNDYLGRVENEQRNKG